MSKVGRIISRRGDLIHVAVKKLLGITGHDLFRRLVEVGVWLPLRPWNLVALGNLFTLDSTVPLAVHT